LTLATELGDEIAQRAVSIAELTSDVGQGTPLKEEGPQSLVVAVQGLSGFAEELLITHVVHDPSSQVSLLFRVFQQRKW
jgi:hypothetical protein